MKPLPPLGNTLWGRLFVESANHYRVGSILIPKPVGLTSSDTSLEA